ncbi:MAG: aminotransferase class IV, partial [bacterium]
DASLEVVDRSRDEIAALGDVWVQPLVTRGVTALADWVDQEGPTVIVALRRFDFSFGPLYDEGGVNLEISLLNRHFTGGVDPRVKANNRLGAVRSELKSRRQAARTGEFTMGVVFSDDGSVSESHGANLGIVVGDTFVRPPRDEALEGISLETVCDLARQLGMTVEARRFTTYDILNADETFIMSTSYGVLPVKSLDGIPLRAGRRTYSQILRAWVDLVGFDFVSQAREQAERLAGA